MCVRVNEDMPGSSSFILLLSLCQEPTGHFAGTLILLIKYIFFAAYFKPAVNNSVFCFIEEECELRGFAQILDPIKGNPP